MAPPLFVPLVRAVWEVQYLPSHASLHLANSSFCEMEQYGSFLNSPSLHHNFFFSYLPDMEKKRNKLNCMPQEIQSFYISFNTLN